MNHVNPATITLDTAGRDTASSFGGRSNVSSYSSFTTTTAFEQVPIKVSYSNPSGNGQMAVFITSGTNTFSPVPTAWLSPDAKIVPRGWTFNHLAGAGAAYSAARIESSEIILTRSDGSTVSFSRNDQGGYTPPPGEDDAVTLTTDNRVLVTDTAGHVHNFRTDGALESVVAPVDAKKPAAPQPAWTTFTLPGVTEQAQRMTGLTDPVSGRSVTFTYQGVTGTPCPSLAGFVAPPAGMLCQITYPDSTATKLYYSNDGSGGYVLSRVVNPGDGTIGTPSVDLGYTQVSVPAQGGGTYTVPMLSSVRDPLVNDAIASGQISATTDYLTQVTYDSKGRAVSVTAPKASAAATLRQRFTVAYQEVGGITVNESRVMIDGLDNAGSSTDWDRKVTFDQTARTLIDYQTANDASTQSMRTETRWQTLADRPLATISNSQATVYRYDDHGWLTDTWGPADDDCFNLVSYTLSGSCTTPPVPHTATAYDQNLSGLETVFWPNSTFSGAPTNLATYPTLNNSWGTDGPAGAINAAGTAKTDDFSMRMTGEIVFPAAGTWTFNVLADDLVRLFIDDQLVAASVCCSAVNGTFTVPANSSLTRRIRVEYAEQTGGATLIVQWAGPGVSLTPVPDSALKPRYGLATTVTVDDSGGAAPSSVTTTRYDEAGMDPVFGLATSTTTAGLTTSTVYEGAGTNLYRRRLSRTLPGGNTTAYDHYNGGGAANVPCTTVDDTTVNQGGLLRRMIYPAAANSQRVVIEYVYDTWGRQVASRYGTTTNGTTFTMETGWTCTSYDVRGRPTATAIDHQACR